MPPSPVLSVEAVQSPKGKHGCKETRPADWSARRAPSQDMSFLCEIWTFRQNDQVRVVTRSLSRLEVTRARKGSPRLSQDANSIAKTAAFVRGGFKMERLTYFWPGRLTYRRQLRADVVSSI